MNKQLIYFPMLIVTLIFASCKSEQIALKASNDYCDCYSKYFEVYQQNDTLIMNQCIKELSTQYEFIRIEYEVYTTPNLAGNTYSYEKLDSVRQLVIQMAQFTEKNCPGIPVL